MLSSERAPIGACTHCVSSSIHRWNQGGIELTGWVPWDLGALAGGGHWYMDDKEIQLLEACIKVRFMSCVTPLDHGGSMVGVHISPG